MIHRFELVGSGLPVRPLLDALERRPALWHVDTWRQEHPGSAHVGTEAIMLRMPREIRPDVMLTGLEAQDWPAYDALVEARPLVRWLLGAGAATRAGRVMVVRLAPGHAIREHVDEGSYATHHARFHVVLASEEGNLFSCGGETIRMRAGEAWWFNQKLPHSVVNDSDGPRIHLIVDLVAPRYLGLRGEMVLFQREYAWDVWEDLERLIARQKAVSDRGGEVDVDRDRDLFLEEAGMLRCYTARAGDGRLLAFCAFTVKYNIHTARPFDIVQGALYVDPDAADDTLGRRLTEYAAEQRRATTASAAATVAGPPIPGSNGRTDRDT